MNQLLGLLLISFVATGVTLVPFIDILFFLKRKFEKNITSVNLSKTPMHDKLMVDDINTPTGAGILLILILVIFSLGYIVIGKNSDTVTLVILIFTLASFGLLGGIDDIKQIFIKRKGKFLGLGRKEVFLIQSSFAIIIGSMLYFWMGLSNVYIPVIGNIVLNFWYIPVAAIIIVSFSNAYNISDGLDGLSAGLLTICLFAFLAISYSFLDLTLASFIGIWIGTLFAFLYFNIWPARVFLGDSGAFAFGATLAVVGLMTGKIFALGIIGGMFVVIVASSFLQIVSKKFFKRRIFPIAPVHMYFKYIGWPEAKIVNRFWLAQALFAILGLWIAQFSR